MIIDIRKAKERIQGIIFASDSHGLRKASKLTNGSGPQVDIVARDGTTIHVRFDELDDFIAALKRARQEWYDE